MAHFITGKDDVLLPWAAKRMPHIQDPKLFGLCKTIGIMTGPEKDARLMAVAVYHQFEPAYQSCQVSVASSNPRWVFSIATVLGIPFIQYDCLRVCFMIAHTDQRSIQCAKRFGFTQEGVLRWGFGYKIHGVVMSMLRYEYDRKYGHGKKYAISATGT